MEATYFGAVTSAMLAELRPAQAGWIVHAILRWKETGEEPTGIPPALRVVWRGVRAESVGIGEARKNAPSKGREQRKAAIAARWKNRKPAKTADDTEPDTEIHTESDTENTESDTENTESDTENTESDTENTESDTENTESDTENTESLARAGDEDKKRYDKIRTEEEEKEEAPQAARPSPSSSSSVFSPKKLSSSSPPDSPPSSSPPGIGLVSEEEARRSNFAGWAWSLKDPVDAALAATGEGPDKSRLYGARLKDLGRRRFLDVVTAFKAEIDAGESVDNPGAALNRRLSEAVSAKNGGTG